MTVALTVGRDVNDRQDQERLQCDQPTAGERNCHIPNESSQSGERASVKAVSTCRTINVTGNSSHLRTNYNVPTFYQSHTQELPEREYTQYQGCQHQGRRLINSSTDSSCYRDAERDHICQHTGRDQSQHCLPPAESIHHNRERQSQFNFTNEQQQANRPHDGKGTFSIQSSIGPLNEEPVIKTSSKYRSIQTTFNSGDQRNTVNDSTYQHSSNYDLKSTGLQTFTSSPTRASFLLREKVTPNVKAKPNKQSHKVNKTRIYVIKQNNISCLPQQLQMSPVIIIKLLNPAIQRPNTKKKVDSINSKKRRGEKEPAAKCNTERSLEPLRAKMQTNHTGEQPELPSILQ